MIDNSKFTILSEFSNNGLEKEYRINQLLSIRYMRPIIICLIIFYSIFLIPDVMLVNKEYSFINIIISRGLFILVMTSFLIIVNRIKNHNLYCLIVSLYEIVISCLYLSIIYHFTNENAILQAIGMMQIVLLILYLPNRWIF